MLAPTQNIEIHPNYTTKSSMEAENRLNTMIDHAEKIGLSVKPIDLSTQEIIDVVKNNDSNRVQLVNSKLEKEGRSLEELPKEVVLDRLLGLDAIINLNGSTFGVDVTTGKGTVLNNKKVKAEQLKVIHNKLGIDHFIVLRLRREITDDLVLDFVSKLEEIEKNNNSYVHTIKYGVVN